MSQETEIKNDVTEIKGDVKALTKSMNELQILVAGNYVTRQDFEDCSKENRGEHSKLWAAIITFYVVVVGWIFNK